MALAWYQTNKYAKTNILFSEHMLSGTLLAGPFAEFEDLFILQQKFNGSIVVGQLKVTMGPVDCTVAGSADFRRSL